MRVRDRLLECVVFIGRTIAGAKPGTREDRYEGTAFFVALQSARVPEISFTYLVTAAHLADVC